MVTLKTDALSGDENDGSDWAAEFGDHAAQHNELSSRVIGLEAAHGLTANLLQDIYDAGTDQDSSTITLDDTRKGLRVRDNATPISTALLLVEAAAGAAQYFEVTPALVTAYVGLAALGGVRSPGTGVESERYGLRSLASGDQSLAVGPDAVASADSGTAVGRGAVASGAAGNATALGRSAAASDDSALAVGTNSQATGVGSTAIGSITLSDSTNSVAVGTAAQAIAASTVAVGAWSVAIGAQSVAAGTGSHAGAADAVALGNTASALGVGSICIGGPAQASAAGAIAIGASAAAGGVEAVAVGKAALAAALGGVAIGSGADAQQQDSVCIGRAVVSSVAGEIVIGKSGTHTLIIPVATSITGATAVTGDMTVTGDFDIVGSRMQLTASSIVDCLYNIKNDTLTDADGGSGMAFQFIANRATGAVYSAGALVCEKDGSGADEASRLLFWANDGDDWLIPTTVAILHGLPSKPGLELLRELQIGGLGAAGKVLTDTAAVGSTLRTLTFPDKNLNLADVVLTFGGVEDFSSSTTKDFPGSDSLVCPAAGAIMGLSAEAVDGTPPTGATADVTVKKNGSTEATATVQLNNGAAKAYLRLTSPVSVAAGDVITIEGATNGTWTTGHDISARAFIRTRFDAD